MGLINLTHLMCETSIGFRDLQKYIEGICFKERHQQWSDYLSPYLEQDVTYINARDLHRFIQRQEGHLFASSKTLRQILAAQHPRLRTRALLLQQDLLKRDGLLNCCGVLWHTKHVWVTNLLEVEYEGEDLAKGKILWVTQDSVTVFEIRWQERNPNLYYSLPGSGLFEAVGPPGRYTNNAS